MTPEKAEELGFATFNDNEHLCVEIPDGYYTISVRTSVGRRITFAFLPYKKDGPAQCVDIVDHDNPTQVLANGKMSPVNDVVMMPFGRTTYDSRQLEPKDRPMITVLLIEDK